MANNSPTAGANGHISQRVRMCVARAVMDYSESVARHRPITPPNLRRLLDRYWHLAIAATPDAEPDPRPDALAFAHAWLAQVIRTVRTSTN